MVAMENIHGVGGHQSYVARVSHWVVCVYSLLMIDALMTLVKED